MTKKIEENREILTRNDLYLMKKEKLCKEIEAAKRILKQNIEPLKIADDFIHNSFLLLKDSISKRYPELTEKGVKLKIKEIISLREKIKSNQKRKTKIG